MTCAVCGENEARYVTSDGRLTCALCPLKLDIRSIRITDLPALFEAARASITLLGNWPGMADTVDNLRATLPK